MTCRLFYSALNTVQVSHMVKTSHFQWSSQHKSLCELVCKVYLSVFIDGVQKIYLWNTGGCDFFIFLQKFMKKLNYFDVVKSYKKSETRKTKRMFWYNINKYFFTKLDFMRSWNVVFNLYYLARFWWQVIKGLWNRSCHQN